jgi:serine/alanine adding enzyme
MDHVEVRECLDENEWDAFLRGRDQTLYHGWKWDGVFKTYGLAIRRFAAFEDGRIVGVLPVVRQRSRLFGDQLVSLPWFDTAGVIAEREGVAETLVRRVAETLREHPRAVVQVRQAEPLAIDAVCRRDKVLMRLPLPATADELWTSLKAKVRNQIRKAEKSGLAAAIGGAELVDDFFEVYGRNMRDLGSPAHARAFFRAIGAAFEGEVRIAVVRLGETAVGAGLLFPNGTALEIPWASSLRQYNGLCVNHLLYWQILSYAANAGFQWFHFGRSSSDSGTYHFKKQWGAEPRQLYWYYLGAERERAERLAQPHEDRFGLAQRIWSRLPVSVTNRLGPRFIARLP